MTTQAKPHGFITRGIHWASGALIGYGYLKGLESAEQLNDPAVLQFEVLYALAIAALFAVRSMWTRYLGGTTRLPEDAPRWEHWASRLVHTGLYASVFGVVLSGLGIAAAHSYAALSGLMGMMEALHEGTLVVLPVLLVLHIVGALWHKLVRGDGVLESMTGRLSGLIRLRRRTIL
mgnify:CR=1 FL=1